jgi:hypothetical protein
MKKKLPIGIQTFSKIINDNYLYVDKTNIAHELIENGEYYFLSRPRRFGKSLFLDTLSEIFKGNKKLFDGLYIYDKWNWNDENKFPVIKISFGSGKYSGKESINNEIKRIHTTNCEKLELSFKIDNINNSREILLSLIKAAHDKYNKKVVILIDEYDKPILDNIVDKEQAIIARDILKNFYSAIKDSDEYIRFVFITGVSKFSKMNLFSGLNNIEDITINSNFATITGYTQDDLKHFFADWIKDVDLEKLKRWYNGYNYFGEPVYNPFDILLFLKNNCEYNNYWWESGNPYFLIEKLKDKPKPLPELEDITIGRETLNAFDVEYIDIVALLWQTGCLTFDKKNVNLITDEILYKMKVPNLEIQLSLNKLFLDYLTDLNGDKNIIIARFQDVFVNNDFDNLKNAFTSLFASIPYNNYANNIIANYEGYYASVVYAALLSMGFDIIAEDTTNRGRIDLTVKVLNTIAILEFKVDTKESAIFQIKEKKYYEKYLNENKDIFLVGVNFGSKDKNITDFEWEKYS